MRTAQVDSLEQANQYLEEHFLPLWQQRFTEVAANPADAHRPLDKQQDLAAILCRIEERTVANDYPFRVDRQMYQIDLKAVGPALRKARVAVQFRLDGTVKVAFQNRLLEAKLCQPDDPVVVEPRPSAPPVQKPRRYTRGSDWNRNFHLKDAPKLGKILSAEKKAGRI